DRELPAEWPGSLESKSRQMIRWRFLEPNPARDLLEQVLQAAGQPHHPRGRGEMMPINVHQTETAVVIETERPGANHEDVELRARPTRRSSRPPKSRRRSPRRKRRPSPGLVKSRPAAGQELVDPLLDPGADPLAELEHDRRVRGGVRRVAGQVDRLTEGDQPLG